MDWKQLENQIEDLLIANDITYDREGVLRTYSHKSGKGKADFKLYGCKYGYIECKHVNNLTRLNYPRPNLKQPLIKTHQLVTLRQNNGGILIYDNQTEQHYFMLPSDLDSIIKEHGLVKSLKGYISHLAIDIEQFIASIKGE